MSISVNEIRKDFPLLENQKVIYLDTAATSQKPTCVMEAEREFYEKYNANPLRGLYELGEAATEKYEEARETVRGFINAKEAAEIIFVRNATEGLNLVAYSFGSLVLKPGDEILVSIMEHHSNLLPWQQAAARTGAVVKYLECTEDGKYTEEAFKEALRYPMCWAAKMISSVLHSWHMRQALISWQTEPRACPIWQWMYRIWMWISWHFPDIKCMLPWESVCYMRRESC